MRHAMTFIVLAQNSRHGWVCADVSSNVDSRSKDLSAQQSFHNIDKRGPCSFALCYRFTWFWVQAVLLDTVMRAKVHICAWWKCLVHADTKRDSHVIYTDFVSPNGWKSPIFWTLRSVFMACIDIRAKYRFDWSHCGDGKSCCTSNWPQRMFSIKSQ